MILPIGKKPKNSPHSDRSVWAFTLIELVLVILLISILVALSSPLFRRTFTDLESRNISFNIAKIINYAQEMSIVEAINYKLNFDFKKGEFWITKLDTSGEEAIYKRISGRYGRTFGLPEGLRFTGDDTDIIFYPDGHCDRSQIRIIDKSGRGRLLRVKGFASQVEIEEIGYE